MKPRRPGRWRRRLLRFLAVFIVLFIVACFVFDALVQFRMSDRELKAHFDRHGTKACIGYYKAGGRTLRYLTVGPDTLPTLLFIHGSPASLSIYNGYYTDTLFQRRFSMVAVDRPGYGYSGLGRPEPSIQKQAAMIRPLLDSLRQSRRPTLVMGGSYGTSVACRLAMDYPHLVDGLILVAPSLAPGEEKTYWFTPAAEHPLVNWFIPRMLRSANTEKLAHEAGLRAMLPYWKNIRVPVIYIQGAKDELIYTTNAAFARQQLVNAPSLDITFLENEPHFIAFSQRPLIKRKMIRLLDSLEGKQ
ncbi:MAG TPA: alpha/beta hydrolase [Chitinophagaceae bacterium]|jgi:pimeloyl-ACP methyl ester carboxylesterase|nr:alpha/beta hydrolase [Chitinophagaceae bacterium]